VSGELCARTDDLRSQRRNDWSRLLSTSKRVQRLAATVFASPRNAPTTMTELVISCERPCHDRCAERAAPLDDSFHLTTRERGRPHCHLHPEGTRPCTRIDPADTRPIGPLHRGNASSSGVPLLDPTADASSGNADVETSGARAQRTRSRSAKQSPAWTRCARRGSDDRCIARHWSAVRRGVSGAPA
jgi:hypothetical protein